MIKRIVRTSLVLATTVFCLSWSGCGQDSEQERKVADDAIPLEMPALDEPPDAASMSELLSVVNATLEAVRKGQYKNLYDLFAPEIRRATPYYQLLRDFDVRDNKPVSLPESLPEPDLTGVRDRVAAVFIADPGERTRRLAQLYLLRTGNRWFLRNIVISTRPAHAGYSAGLISPGSTQQDLTSIKESMVRKALISGKDFNHPDGFPGVSTLKRSLPVFVATDVDLDVDTQIRVPGWTLQVVPESKAIAGEGANHYYFTFGVIQIFGDLALGHLSLGHPDANEGGGFAMIWLVRTGGRWQFYKYEARFIS